MPNVFATNVAPENLQWWGIGRELIAGTIVAPVITIPLEKGQPSDNPTMLVDKMLRGYMGEDYGDIQGTEIADFPLSGDVLLDSIGHLVYNLMGDYTATGTTGTGSTTLTAPLTAGATTATVAAISGFSSGQAVQIGITADGNPEIVVLSTAPSGSTLTFTNTPARFSHASGKQVAGMVAPFSHTFSLMNNVNASTLGTNADCQPPTHTITYHNNLSGTYLARQYAYWVASGMDFKLNSEQLFQHDTKGLSVIGADAASAPTNTQGTAVAIPDWEFKVGIGGPASGGTLVNNIESADISIARNTKAKFMMNGQQAPYIIARLGLGVTGKLTFMAQDESPLTTLLANTQQQLQIAMTQGSGATTLGCTFNFALAAYEKAPINAPDVLTWDVDFRGLMNTTNAGATGGMSPMSIVLVNAIPTY